MGSIRKRNGKYQAQVRREGVKPISKTFQTKKDAEIWVRGIEARIDAGETNVSAPKATTLAHLLSRYSQEVTPAKKGRSMAIFSSPKIAKVSSSYPHHHLVYRTLGVTSNW